MSTSPPPRPRIPDLAELDLDLVTPRLRLRNFEDRDVDDLWPTVSDPTFPQWMSWTAHKSPDETRAFVEGARRARREGDGVTWVIERDGRAVGCISLDGIQWVLRALRVDRAELGYWIAREAWGEGFMTEAATAVVHCAFETIGLHKVTVSSFADNLASRRVIEKLGFRYVGTNEDDVWRDGRWHDHLRFELTAPELLDAQTTMRIQRPVT